MQNLDALTLPQISQLQTKIFSTLQLPASASASASACFSHCHCHCHCHYNNIDCHSAALFLLFLTVCMSFITLFFTLFILFYFFIFYRFCLAHIVIIFGADHASFPQM